MRLREGESETEYIQLLEIDSWLRKHANDEP
jgi:hypothetical protein